MKKTFLTIALVSGLMSFTSVSNAQTGRFSLGAELGIPMGDLGDAVSIGFGATVRYEHPIGENIGLSLTTGFLTFGGKTTDIDLGGGTVISYSGPAIGMLPIQAGFKYYFTEQQLGFYAMAEVGVHMTTIAAVSYAGYAGESASSTDLSYAPEIGYCLENFDFGLRYQMISASNDVVDFNTGAVTTETTTNSYLGLRIAYVFGSTR